MRRPKPGRDSAVLLGVFLASLAVMALAPPAASTSAAPAASGVGSSTAGATAGGTPTPTPTTASGAATATPTPRRASGGNTTTTTAQRVKLMNTRYARFSYLISGKTLSSNAKRALDGFEWNRTRLNASAVEITLTPTQPRYQSYSAVVRSGQKLYFIEASFGDDAPKREAQLRDDAPVKVDNHGYVIQ